MGTSADRTWFNVTAVRRAYLPAYSTLIESMQFFVHLLHDVQYSIHWLFSITVKSSELWVVPSINKQL